MPSIIHRRVIILIGAVLLLRIVLAALLAVNPADDEAYYWDWGRNPDLGYYSKPPLIGWLYALVDSLGGGSIFAIRATAALLGAASLYLFYRLAAALFGAETGWLAAVVGLAVPANAALSWFLTIDAPLMLCWTAALWMTWRIASGGAGAGTFLALFLALALGHLSKQMMMLFPPLAVLFLSLREDTRPALRRPALWAALLGSYLSLIPPLLWNARNDWITFRHTADHFGAGGGEQHFLAERAAEFFTFLGTQFGVLSPGLAAVVLLLCLAGLPSLRSASPAVRLLLVFGALPLAFVLLLATTQKLQPNWPAVFYISGLVLAAAWYRGQVRFSAPPRLWRGTWHRRTALITGFALVGYFHFAPLAFEAAGRPGHQADPDRRLLGHDRMAAGFESVRRAQPDAGQLVVAAAGGRALTSQLAFGLPDRPRVYRWNPQGRVNSQYEVWNNPLEDGLGGRDALILTRADHELPAEFFEHFQAVEVAGEFEVDYTHRLTRSFTVLRGRSLQGWSDPFAPPGPGAPPSPAPDP